MAILDSAQYGNPTGLSLKFYRPNGISIDLLGSWDYDNYTFLTLHGLNSGSILDSRRLQYFYGPGVFISIERQFFDQTDVLFGFSGAFGLSYFLKKLEFFIQVNPRLRLIDSTRASMGGGVGLRFYI